MKGQIERNQKRTVIPLDEQLNKNLQMVLDQMEAYNRRDVEGCLRYWADDLQVLLMPEEEVILSNKQEAREFLEKEFAKGLETSSRVVEKKADGAYVCLVHEEFGRDGFSYQMRFAYLIEKGLLSKMWSLPVE